MTYIKYMIERKTFVSPDDEPSLRSFNGFMFFDDLGMKVESNYISSLTEDHFDNWLVNAFHAKKAWNGYKCLRFYGRATEDSGFVLIGIYYGDRSKFDEF